MPKTFIRQFITRDNQVYNIYKVVNTLGQKVYEAESTKPYVGTKRAMTETELTTMLNRPVESAYTVKPNTIVNSIDGTVKPNTMVSSEAKINVR